ncbi:intracellular serine protease [Fusarium austroafricanum]|uniref:Intracellular serine protease n=1 Tax=Fusarium austroafricanum TaxID=2364996 RepID=A0A8H4KES7_9HYPO|nr:intracellular serine protease [Fusarium austroafricanum]
MLGFFAGKRPQRSGKPASLRSRRREAWLRTDAFLQCDGLGDADPESVQRTLHLAVRVSKRRREYNDVIEELSHSDHEREKRRVLPREEPTLESDADDPDADFAVLMRRHLVTLDNAWRRHWICVYQKCSGLSVRLSLPQHKKDLTAEASFEVFFGVRSIPATALQEAKITRPNISGGILISLVQSPAGIASWRIGTPTQREASISCHTGFSTASFPGDTLVTVLLRSLKDPVFEPRQNGELPDITKPFLALEHVPTISSRTLGILLCEPHYCTPVEPMGKDPHASRNFNDDFHTCIDKLQTLEDDAGVDYYLATKASLCGEYYPIEQHTDFEDVSVQRLFYQTVVKRLEAVIFKAWCILLENLGSFDSRQNESCWGPIGREVVRLHTGEVDSSNAEKAGRTTLHRSMSDTMPMSHALLHPNIVLPKAAQPSSGSQACGHLNESPEKSFLVF